MYSPHKASLKHCNEKHSQETEDTEDMLVHNLIALATSWLTFLTSHGMKTIFLLKHSLGPFGPLGYPSGHVYVYVCMYVCVCVCSLASIRVVLLHGGML